MRFALREDKIVFLSKNWAISEKTCGCPVSDCQNDEDSSLFNELGKNRLPVFLVLGMEESVVMSLLLCRSYDDG